MSDETEKPFIQTPEKPIDRMAWAGKKSEPSQPAERNYLDEIVESLKFIQRYTGIVAFIIVSIVVLQIVFGIYVGVQWAKQQERQEKLDKANGIVTQFDSYSECMTDPDTTSEECDEYL